MSRLRTPTFLAIPLRPAFGSAAETRSAKIWAKRSAKRSNGREERLAIALNDSVSGLQCKRDRCPLPPLVHKLENEVDGRSVLGLEGIPHLMSQGRRNSGGSATYSCHVVTADRSRGRGDRVHH